MGAKWEYRVSYVHDDVEAADAQAKLWADDGWELVNGSTSTFVTKDGNQWAPAVHHTMFTFFWRRAIDTAS